MSTNYVAPDYKLLRCNCGSYDVGAGGFGKRFIANCYKCQKKIEGESISKVIRAWNDSVIDELIKAQPCA